MPDFRILRLDHVVLRAREPEGLIRFYCEVLGCSVERKLAVGLTQLRAGEALIDILDANSKLGAGGGLPPSLDNGGKNLDHFCLRIEPFVVADVQAHLRTHGIEGSPPMEVYGAEGFGLSIYIKDPEGNVIELKGPADRVGK